jgi:hypothetical protein
MGAAYCTTTGLKYARQTQAGVWKPGAFGPAANAANCTRPHLMYDAQSNPRIAYLTANGTPMSIR